MNEISPGVAIRTTATRDTVCSSIVHGNMSVAAAEMDWMGDHWWIARVVVKPQHRRKHYGTMLIAELQKRSGGHKIVVCPGGYNMPRESQDAFYISCGLKAVNKDTLEWKQEIKQ